jgi:uncharacterized Ntn-hydrolase superfamily protein
MPPAPTRQLPRPSTFSIAAHDPDAQEWGVAVASKFLAVGSVVPFARAGVGAVATQSYANTTFGPAGLELMSQGYSAPDALSGLIAADQGRDQRQVGLVDAAGRAATFTGSECYSWAGGRTGEHYAAQGNILTGPEVVDRMVESYEALRGDLVDRLLAALSAGDAAGGDSRGRQSATVLVVKSGGGYAGFNDRYVDLRVDDHPAPIVELQRLVAMHRLYMSETRPEDILALDEGRTQLIQEILRRSGHRDGPIDGVYDEETRTAFRALNGAENLEGRWREEAEVDRVVLDYLGERFPPAG